MTNAVTIAQYGSVSPNKNRIINGSMVIDQRNAGASSTTATTSTQVYSSLDRWAYVVSQASKFTMQQTGTGLAGFPLSLGCVSTAATSVGSGDYFQINQVIEGFNIADLNWGTANAKTITLSFWVYSSLTGTFGGALRNSAYDRSYPFTYTISSANTWEQKSVTVAGDTSGTWLTTNGAGIRVTFSLGMGSTYSAAAGAWATGGYASATGATNVVSTNGATWYITGVQLEAGSAASPFEYRSYGTELALCQRYYQKSYDQTIAPGTATTYGCTAMRVYGYYPSYYSGTIYFTTAMRTSPSMTAYNPISGASGTWQTAGVYSGAVSVSFNYGGNQSIQWQAGDGTSQDFTYGLWTATAEL